MPYFGGIPEGPKDEDQYKAKYWITSVLLISVAYLLALNIARWLGWEPNAPLTFLLLLALSYLAGRISNYLPK